MDLQGDEELEALRLAALATLKSHSKKKDSESSVPDNISKVSTLITSKSDHQKKDLSDHAQGSAYGNQQSWRNSALSRRGRGRQFPKGNQRSNLIVITPVNLCKNTDEKETPPQLILPQHKWCQSVNEDSSSPKSYRRIGPSRFNRHGSDSESSDESEIDVNSDNDSYSNDTVLQDEPSEPFSAFTAEENTEDERLEKQQPTHDRRLSFHNIESQENDAESVHNSRKDAYSNSSKEETKSYKAVPKEDEPKLEREFSDNHRTITSVGDEQETKPRSHSPIQFKKSQNISISVNGSLHSKKDNISRNHVSVEKETYKSSRKYLDKQVEAGSHHDFIPNDSRNHSKNLSEGDLRYELKKRMQDKPIKPITSRSQNDSYDHHRSPEQNKNHVRLRRSNSSDDSDNAYRHKSRDRKFRDHKSGAQSHSSSENDNSASPSRNHVSHNRLQTDTRTNRKRKHSHSSERSYKRSQSPEQRVVTQGRGPRRHSGSSSSSTSSSSNASKSSKGPRLRLVSSVVKPVARTDDSRIGIGDVSEKHPLSSTESSSNVVFKRRRNSDEKPKILSSIKSSVCGNDKNINSTDIVKRVPVHMRLGTLPHKRIIRMTKDVEKAFISTSSDEDTDVNMKFKKQNYRVVTELSGNKLDEVSKRHVEKGTCRNIDVFKGRRMKVER